MARETKTVQCYPSDYQINKMCERYNSFGWELINNQRCTEDNGTYGGYKHTTTYNKLTFTREKASPWYDKVVALENEYERIMNSEPYFNEKTNRKIIGIMCCIFGILAFLVGIMQGVLIGIIPALIFCGLGIILIAIFSAGTVRRKRARRDYEKRKDEWEQSSGARASEILKESDAIVNSK